MKTWIFIITLFGLTCSKAIATESSVIGGRIVFEQSCSSCQPIVPETWEINLSTTLVVIIDGKMEEKFENHDEWVSCQTKLGLKRKIRKIRALIDSMSDLPAADSKDLKERAGWLKSYFQSLP